MSGRARAGLNKRRMDGATEVCVCFRPEADVHHRREFTNRVFAPETGLEKRVEPHFHRVPHRSQLALSLFDLYFQNEV